MATCMKVSLDRALFLTLGQSKGGSKFPLRGTFRTWREVRWTAERALGFLGGRMMRLSASYLTRTSGEAPWQSSGAGWGWSQGEQG